MPQNHDSRPSARRLRRAAFTAIVGLSLFTGSSQAVRAADGEPLDVHEVEAAAASHLDRSLTMTGRFEQSTGNRVQLIGSEIDVRVASRGGGIARGDAVRVSGRLARESGRLVFEATDFREIPPDLERFGQAADDLIRQRDTGRRVDLAVLASLERAARARGAWYDDRSLLDFSDECRERGFTWEVEDAVAAKRTDALFELATRAETEKLPFVDVSALRHRALWFKYERLGPRDAEGRTELAAEVQESLAGAETPPEREPPEAAQYLADPISRYEGAGRPLREVFHRVFWAELTSQALRSRSNADGADLGRLADEAEALVPERPALARQFRQTEFVAQSKDPGSLSRGQLLSVERGLKEHELNQQAENLVKAWLSIQRTRLTPDDAEGRLQLAADSIQLAGDEATAVELYLEVDKLAPGNPDAERELRRLGYDRRGGTWQLTSEISRDAVREERTGQIAAGMSDDDVIKRFRSPDRIARTLTRGQITEQWIYDGPPRLVILLERKTGDKNSRVTAIRSP